MRYSLRRRDARQLNPYAYDKLLYRQQLKSHPDAIVKFRSPRRRSGSGGAGEDGTQEEFMFPLDGPDEDGDYVDVEDESGRRRRRRVQNVDRNNGEGGQGLEVRQIDEGWLPEALKALSSSDEDDNEIHKLARRARREREKAESMARAQARRAAAEARQAETEAKKAAKRRLKPFPVHNDAEHVSERFPERVPPLVSLLVQHFIICLKSSCCCQTGTVTFLTSVLPSALGAHGGFISLILRKITFQTPRVVPGVFPFPSF